MSFSPIHLSQKTGDPGSAGLAQVNRGRRHNAVRLNLPEAGRVDLPYLPRGCGKVSKERPIALYGTASKGAWPCHIVSLISLRDRVARRRTSSSVTKLTTNARVMEASIGDTQLCGQSRRARRWLTSIST